ncbi:MAG: PEP-CTERM sorting domain-containing protein [Puniceicoccales bacterium]|nr:PEP-CTERM sorting domain-containing protein [Puniceicoccales bacterium]
MSLAIGGSVIATEGLVYTIVESPIGGITGTFNNLPEGAILAGMTTGQEFTVHYTPYEITLTAGAPIPEPSTYALLGGVGAVALVLASRWRRRQR